MSAEPRTISASARLHYLDTLRAFIMTFGVVLHAALWTQFHHWIPTSISFASGLFRMKLFMILSGYFAALIAEKRGVDYAVKERVIRFGVPATIFIIIFNPLTIYIWHYDQSNPANLFRFTYENFTMTGKQSGERAWHLHMWFLIVVTVYAAFLGLFAKASRLKVISKAVEKLSRYRPSTAIFILSVSSALMFVAGRTMHFATAQQLLQNGPYNYVVQATYCYVPYFLLGFVAFRFQAIFLLIHYVSWAQFFVSVVLLGIVKYYQNHLVSLLGFPASEAIRHFFSAVVGFYMCCLLLNMFSKFFARESQIGSFLSKASYTVYLFHMLALVLVEKVLSVAGVQGAGLYILCIIMGYGACLGLHHIIMKSSVLEFIFNGKTPVRKTTALTSTRIKESA